MKVKGRLHCLLEDSNNFDQHLGLHIKQAWGHVQPRSLLNSKQSKSLSRISKKWTVRPKRETALKGGRLPSGLFSRVCR